MHCTSSSINQLEAQDKLCLPLIPWLCTDFHTKVVQDQNPEQQVQEENWDYWRTLRFDLQNLALIRSPSSVNNIGIGLNDYVTKIWNLHGIPG